MKHMYQDNIKPFLKEEIISTIDELGLTKEQASELLGIEPRSYAYLKNGTNMCSASTLLLYLVKICPDPVRFIETARKIVLEAEQI